MKKWEYKTLKFIPEGVWGGVVDTQNVEITLNSLGKDGWELVTNISTALGQGRTREVIMVLKREIV